MNEGYSDYNSENPDDSTLEAGTYADTPEMTDAILNLLRDDCSYIRETYLEEANTRVDAFEMTDDILRKIKNGQKFTIEDSTSAFLLASEIFLRTESLRIDEWTRWTPELAAIRELLDNTEYIMRYDKMSLFAEWFERKVREIDANFAQNEATTDETSPTDVIAERPNSNHLLDRPLR